MALFSRWFHDAVKEGVPEPEAMTLSTTALPSAEPPAYETSAADKKAWRVAAPRPSARIVLLKQADENGFHFYTNYASRKGRELEANPWCSLTFFWSALHRSVRVLGRAQRLPRPVSQAYFDSRPLGSRIGAWASPQSEAISSRQELLDRVVAQERRFDVPDAALATGDMPVDVKIPVPEHWGGYVVVPDEIEFWVGRVSRLHDRFRCARTLPTY